MSSLAGLAFGACAQTGQLNDTGQGACFDGQYAEVPCDAATAGNSGTLPHQDGRYGRDAAQEKGALKKVGAGRQGFDFSCVLWNGTVSDSATCSTTLAANTNGFASVSPETDWACTKDNVTGLVWSLQSLQTTTWVAAQNTASSYSRCGYSSGWRLPTRRELLSITYHGSYDSSFEYFPATKYGWYWASDVYPENNDGRRIVRSFSVETGAAFKDWNYYFFARLVHNVE